MEKNSFAITLLSHRNNTLLFHTLKNLFINTDFTLINVNFFILLQNCNESYINIINTIISSFKKSLPDSSNLIFEIIIIDNNIGLSKANNLLYEKTVNFEYVLHIEDDWILVHDNKDWLNICLNTLINNKELSTICLRKYSSDIEKHKYGWSRCIEYMCHKNKGNFNYSTKLTKIDDNFTQIKNFLFTFNPVIRRNKDYIKCGVYPLHEFNDFDKNLDINFKETKNHDADNWGYCEAFAMEKTIELNTYMYKDGIFVHYDDWDIKSSLFYNYSEIYNF
jgi:hypothetical protein